MRRVLRPLFFLSGLLFFIAGCSSSPPVSVTLTPSSAVVFSTQTVQLNATDSQGASDVVWSVPGSTGATIDSTGMFTAPSVTQNTSVTVTAASKHDPTKMASSVITVVASGQVSTTNEPQVALYTLTPPAGMQAFIEFSTDTSYNLKTWTQPAPSSGPLSFFVAGMRGGTEYHMRAVLVASDNSQINDLDHTFTTQALAANQLPAITVSTTPGMTPQSGVEVLDLISKGATPAAPLAVYDLSGNLLWSYYLPAGTSLEGVHLLPNGHFILGAFRHRTPRD
jgi:hypothetical protein